MVRAAVRSRSRLHLPERRPARRVRAAVRAGLHADRHHRRRRSPAIRRASTPSADEIDYLCAAANGYFRAADRAGRRGLVVRRRALALRRRLDASRRTRRATTCWRSTSAPALAPLLTVYGGKITTYRRLAEQALERLAPIVQGRAGLDREARTCRAAISPGTASRRWWPRPAPTWPFLDAELTRGGWCAPTARASTACSMHARRSGDLGPSFGADLSAAEVRYLMQRGMGAHRRRRAVAAVASSACASPPTSASGSPNSWPEHWRADAIDSNCSGPFHADLRRM